MPASESLTPENTSPRFANRNWIESSASQHVSRNKLTTNINISVIIVFFLMRIRFLLAKIKSTVNYNLLNSLNNCSLRITTKKDYQWVG